MVAKEDSIILSGTVIEPLQLDSMLAVRALASCEDMTYIEATQEIKVYRFMIYLHEKWKQGPDDDDEGGTQTSEQSYHYVLTNSILSHPHLASIIGMSANARELPAQSKAIPWAYRKEREIAIEAALEYYASIKENAEDNSNPAREAWACLLYRVEEAMSIFASAKTLLSQKKEGVLRELLVEWQADLVFQCTAGNNNCRISHPSAWAAYVSPIGETEEISGPAEEDPMAYEIGQEVEPSSKQGPSKRTKGAGAKRKRGNS
jgi:hypothetical protein